jgi:hypothetical protein
MYNGYNYYQPNGDSTSPPVYLMPYPYQFDPFFMAPNTEVPAGDNTEEAQQNGDATESNAEKTENEDGAKENNSAADAEQNVSVDLFSDGAAAI